MRTQCRPLPTREKHPRAPGLKPREHPLPASRVGLASASARRCVAMAAVASAAPRPTACSAGGGEAMAAREAPQQVLAQNRFCTLIKVTVPRRALGVGLALAAAGPGRVVVDGERGLGGAYGGAVVVAQSTLPRGALPGGGAPGPAPIARRSSDKLLELQLWRSDAAPEAEACGTFAGEAAAACVVLWALRPERARGGAAVHCACAVDPRFHFGAIKAPAAVGSATMIVLLDMAASKVAAAHALGLRRGDLLVGIDYEPVGDNVAVGDVAAKLDALFSLGPVVLNFWRCSDEAVLADIRVAAAGAVERGDVDRQEARPWFVFEGLTCTGCASGAPRDDASATTAYFLTAD
ncbi:hypothetical protein M885DRAFT_627074 [Pelagophyceae sp. CCMP2097]|nr:hypothetical protein M885DRAFT_627074 [Pelagophyceae sp. CCMP2097]